MTTKQTTEQIRDAIFWAAVRAMQQERLAREADAAAKGWIRRAA